MKKKILTVCLFALFWMSAYGQDDMPSAKKYYCNAEQIELTDSMILIHLEDNQYELDGLLTDQGGLYFTEEMLRCTYSHRPLKNICECPHPTFQN